MCHYSRPAGLGVKREDLRLLRVRFRRINVGRSRHDKNSVRLKRCARLIVEGVSGTERSTP